MHKNPDGSITHPVVICDSIGAQGTTKANVQRGIDKKVIRVFDTLKELADFYKIPYEGLKKPLMIIRGIQKTEKTKSLTNRFLNLTI